MNRGTGDPLGVGLEQHLVRPGCLVVGVKQEVTVPLDESRQECRTWQDDLYGASRGRYREPHLGDARTEHEHRPAVMQLLTVEETVRAQDNGLLRLETRRDGQSGEK